MLPNIERSGGVFVTTSIDSHCTLCPHLLSASMVRPIGGILHLLIMQGAWTLRRTLIMRARREWSPAGLPARETVDVWLGWPLPVLGLAS